MMAEKDLILKEVLVRARNRNDGHERYHGQGNKHITKIGCIKRKRDRLRNYPTSEKMWII